MKGSRRRQTLSGNVHPRWESQNGQSFPLAAPVVLVCEYELPAVASPCRIRGRFEPRWLNGKAIFHVPTVVPTQKELRVPKEDQVAAALRSAASSSLFLPARARLICIQMRLLLLKMGKLAFTRCPLTLARSSIQRPKLHIPPQSGFFCRYVSMMSQELRRRVVDIRLQV